MKNFAKQNSDLKMKIDYSDFLTGGCASTGATLFTNPIEVIKTRIQLQGELSARGTYAEPYKGILNAFITVWKNEGIYGLQKGLVPALYFQFIINAFRLGIYHTAVQSKWVENPKTGQISFARGVFWGGFGGMVGSVVSSPFFLVKTQLQSGAAKQIAVGYQHHHTSMTKAFTNIYKKNGFRGLWRGVLSTVPRSVIGSGAQISSFGVCKDFLRRNDIVVNKTLNSFASGIIAGSFMSMAITPPDVIATRLYNQGVDDKGKGIYYRGIIDCFIKIFRSEGLYGFYKGFWPNYLRIAPHSTLVLLFFDELLALQNERL